MIEKFNKNGGKQGKTPIFNEMDVEVSLVDAGR